MASLVTPSAAAELRYDLAAELEMVRRQNAALLNGRATRTLVSDGPLRVTLVSMEPGGSMARHEAAVPTVVQPLDGEVLVTAGERRHALHAGELLSLGPHVPHSIESRTGGSFLLTVVLPPTAD
jgi:quercetin dioxygenase-like cupin family protein